MTQIIPDEHVLPCDFIVGHMRFRKGVKLETVRKAAERWLKVATRAYFSPAEQHIRALDEAIAALGVPNGNGETGGTQ